VRFKDSNGLWGKSRSILTTISNPDIGQTAYVKAAEYFIDSDPGKGLGAVLTAQDGTFNDTLETLSGTYVDNYGLTHGTHYLRVRARNSLGHWGNVSSTALQIVDVTKPTVTISSTETSLTSTSPIPITITFNEPVTGFDSSDVTISNGLKGALTGTEMFNDTTFKTYSMDITPLSDGNVAVSVPTGVASDLGSNTNTASTTFNIIYDNTGPVVNSYSPSDDGFGVNKNSNLQITFNENIFKGEGNLSIYQSNGTIFEKIDVAGNQIAISDSMVTINPNGTFSIGTSYYVKIDNDVFKDVAGNFYQGIYNSTTWNFSVVSDTEYLGTAFRSYFGVRVGTLDITENGTLTDLAVKINVSGKTSNFLQYISLSLISPSGKSVYLVGGDQIKSGGLGSNSGSSFTNTVFTDGAQNSIYGGSSPFIGNFKPEQMLSVFDGESIQGTWNLVLNNLSTERDTVYWSLLINADDTDASQPIAYGTEYIGSVINSTLGVQIDTINISEAGTLTDLEAEINITGSTTNFLRYTSIILMSPRGDPVYLYGGDQVTQGGLDQYSGPDMYRTIFDDESDIIITNGFAPFIGQHKPVELLSKFKGQLIAGTWTLIVYNNSNDNGSVNWSLFLESDNSTPIASVDSGTVYIGKQLTTSSIGVIDDIINITSTDTITNMYVEATIDGSTSNFLRYVSLSLQSPKGTVINLFSGDQVTQGGLDQYSGSDMYRTQFNDEGRIKIVSGKAPFVGPHKPSDKLSDLFGEALTGDWKIYFNNISNDSGTLDWKLFTNPETTIPQVFIASTEGSRTTRTTIPIIVSFTEDVTGFDTSKVKITNGTIDNFNGSGAEYTFDIIPVIQGDITVNIAENVAQDISGNGNTAASEFSIYFDVIPTVVVSSTSTSPTNSIPIPIKIKFSEEVSGFDSLDIALNNGLLSGFKGDKDVYEFALNPISPGDVTVDVPKDAAKDTTNNGNLASATFTITYTTIPSVVISSSVDSITNLSPIPIKVTFSKNVIGFISSDITIANGTVANFTGSGLEYNFDLVPTSDGTVTVDINGNVAADSDGNGNYAAQQFSIIFDKTSPIVTVSTAVQSPTQLTLIPISFEFTETVIGLDSSDVTIDNGTLKNLIGWDKSYTFDVVPDGAGYVGILLQTGKVTDIAGNGNEASSYFTVKYDDNIHLDSFDNLETWTNTTNSSISNELWYIVNDGYSGKAARSDVGGFGYGDKLSKEYEFTADVKARLMVKKQAGYTIKAYFKSDNVELWSFGDTGDTTDQFVVKDAYVSKGKRTISIETDYSGSIWIDELQIETVTNPLVSITSFFISPTNSSRIPIEVSFTNPVTGFQQSDLKVNNGSVSNFSGSEMEYSFDVIPAKEGDVTIDIAADVAQDENNEGNKEATPFVINYDISAPQQQLKWELQSLTNKTEIPINVSFNEPIKNLLSSDFELLNCKIDSFSGKDSLFYLEISPLESGELSVKLPSSTFFDIAGNENLISDSLSIIYDGVAPIIGLVKDGEAADINFQKDNKKISASWSGFKDNETGIKEYLWSIGTQPGGIDIQDWKSVNLNTVASNDSLTLQDGRYFISVIAIDSAGNESNYASSDGVKVDTQVPSVPQKLKAAPGDMSISLTWSSNPETDLEKYIIYRSEISGFNPSKADSIGEVDFRESIYIDNNLEWAKDYYYSTSVKDSTGHLSNYSNEATSTPYDLTNPNIVINAPLQKASFEVGTNANIEWTGTDNSGYLTVQLEYKYGTKDWISIASEEENDGVYVWMAPNTPAKDISLRLIGKDGFGNTDTSTVNNIEIFFVYPDISDISPISASILNWYNDGIRIQFSRAMDSTTMDENTITYKANHSPLPSLNYDKATYSLVIGQTTGFASSDTIYISLDASNIKSTFGYELNGPGGNDIDLVYKTAMYADYDTSSTIDEIDLSYFVIGLEENNLQYELGPVVGTPPYFNAKLDGTYNIDDLMTFVMMWNWYSSNNSSTFNEYNTLGEGAFIESALDSIIVNIPENVFTYQIQVKYPSTVKIIDPDKIHDISFSNNYENDGIYNFLSKNYDNKQIVIRTTSKLKGNNISVNFRGVGSDGTIIAQTMESVYVEGVPEQFALHQNYPNPFNPITTINYDLPVATHVNLIIYDILGREVIQLVNKEMSAGYQTIIWKGKNNFDLQVSAGVYFYHLQTKNFSKTKKMVYLK